MTRKSMLLALSMTLGATCLVVGTLFVLQRLMTDAEFIDRYGDIVMTAIGAVSLVWLWFVVHGRS